jgi:hypothetical protein
MTLKRASILAAAVLAISGVTAAHASPKAFVQERGGKAGQGRAEEGSTARIIQRGDAHQAIIEQSGDGNRGRIIQIGEGRSAVLQQEGGQRFNIIQVNRGRASVDIQTGPGNAGASRRGR